MSKPAPKVKITGLWKKVAQDESYSYYNGYDNGKNWQVHPNSQYTPGSKQPEFFLFVAGVEKQE